jgi:tetratricopeptide (TPR) repeat protein
MKKSMPHTFKRLIRSAAIVSLICAALPHGASAVGTEPASTPQIDPAACLAAIAANDSDAIVAACTALIDDAKTSTPDRLKALIARGGVYGARDMLDRAIADYDAVLRLDSTLADIFNARGELWRKKGDRRRAVADFGAAIKLDPQDEVARANYRSLALELERLGALLAVNGKPSFNCATARHAAEKAICANPELANIDRDITAANARVVRKANEENPRSGQALQRAQDEFIARRNAAFGQPGYDLQKAMTERLDQLKAIVQDQGVAPTSFDLK